MPSQTERPKDQDDADEGNDSDNIEQGVGGGGYSPEEGTLLDRLAHVDEEDEEKKP